MAVKKFSLEAVIDLTDKMTKPIQNLEKNMLGFSKKMQKSFGGTGKTIKSIDSGINKAAVGIGAVAVAGGVAAIALGKSFIDAGAEVEKYKTTLTTMLGSQEEANKRFEEYSKFAASTPFELNEVVALGNQLQALGKYSKENMTTLGDLASAAGKPIDQVTGAFAKLASGQKGEAVNMFRELLISTDDWAKATGKGVKKNGELMATTEEMIAALPKILGAKGFSGMMANLSKTNEGISSNFKDTITRFKQGVGAALLPAWNKLLVVLTGVVEKFTSAFNANGVKYVDMIAAGIERLADWISKIDIGSVVAGFMDFLKTIKAIWSAISPFLPVILVFAAEIKIIVGVMAAYNAIMAVAAVVTNGTLWPVLAVIAAVAILAIGVIALVKHWDDVVAVLKVVGGFFVNIGQTIMKWLLLPINLVLDAIGGLLSMLSKLPGVGAKLAPAINALNGFQSGMNRTLTGTEGATDFGGVWKGSSQGYANPATRTASSNTTNTSRNVVDLQAPAGWGMMPQGYGGAPRQTLNFGGAQ